MCGSEAEISIGPRKVLIPLRLRWVAEKPQISTQTGVIWRMTAENPVALVASDSPYADQAERQVGHETDHHRCNNERW